MVRSDRPGRVNHWNVYASGGRDALEKVEADLRRRWGWPTQILGQGEYPEGATPVEGMWP